MGLAEMSVPFMFTYGTGTRPLCVRVAKYAIISAGRMLKIREWMLKIREWMLKIREWSSKICNFCGKINKK